MFAIKCQRKVTVILQQMRFKSILLNKKFNGLPTGDNFKLVEGELPSLQNGQFLVQAEYLSVDPYMWVFPTSSDIGKPVMGEQVAKIIESKSPKFPVGERVVGEFGWQSHTVASEAPGAFFRLPPRILKGLKDLSPSLALGAVGMPGNTAYFGLLVVCKPREKDTVVVSGAGGAVGTLVGQIAKIKGCKVVGITGSDEKGRRLVNDLGFDAYVNYKSEKFEEELVNATQDRVDCYFDNVGGEVSSAVLNRMNKFGRVAICGSISTYNSKGPSKAPEVQTPVKIHHLKMEGFSVTRWHDQWEEGIEQNLQWIREGKLKYPETITEGFENTPKAFIGMLKGENFGKAIVKV